MNWQLSTVNNEIIEAEKIGCGAYGNLFKCDKGRVFKIFQIKTSAYREFISLKTFEDQCKAYEKAQKPESLNSLVPKYYGRYELSRIEHLDEDVTSNYYPKCCYSIEYIESVATPEETQVFKDRYEAEFHNHGIMYTIDCEIRKGADGFKMIDFGTQGVLERIEELCNYNEANFSDAIKITFNHECKNEGA
jgi:hypothetical protein